MSDASVRKKQIRNFLVTFTTILAVWLFIQFFLGKPKPQKNYKEKLSNFSTNTKPENIVESWKDKLEENSQKSQQELQVLRQEADKKDSQIAAQQKQLDMMSEQINAVIEAQKLQQMHNQKFESHQAGTQTRQAKSDIFATTQPMEVVSAQHFPSTSTEMVAGQQASSKTADATLNEVRPAKLQHIKIERKGVDTHAVDTYLPAGTFVRGTILGGMMAGAGTSSQDEPRPMLIKLIDDSQLPNKVRRHVKGCTITASGYGDISSERAFIKTETMSCVLKDDRVFEEQIKAYVAGGDSMGGVRGPVIRREYDMIKNAFVSGVVSSGANAIQQGLGTVSTSPLGSVKTNDKKDIAAGILSGGISGSANKISEYFVDLAKQHHPVIEVSPGQEVTVVLLKGFSFKGVVR